FAVMQAQAARVGVAAGASFRGVAAGLFGVTAAAGTATRAMQIFRAVLMSTIIGAAAVGLGLLLTNLTPVAPAMKDNSISAEEYNDAMGKLAKSSSDVADKSDDAKKGVGKVGKAAKGAAEEVRTLVDYASDLAGVFDRAADIRFGSQAAL